MIRQYFNRDVPQLEQGDHLSSAEFNRRYEAMPDLKKAELIDGVVHMPSPVRLESHGRPHAKMIGWLIQYEAATSGVAVADNSTAKLDLDNEPQPDALLMIDPELGGQARISDDDYVLDGPELVAEITSSSASFDRNTKLAVYRRHGVLEYIIWRVLDQEIDWFILRDSVYQPLQPDTDEILKSPTFPGLWLDAKALCAGDLAKVLAVVQSGTRTTEHQDFLKRLTRNRSSG